MKTIDLSVIIPCYNEEENIPLVAERFKEIIPKDINIEVIMVDNGSSDKTNKLIKKYTKKYSFIKLAVVRENKGFGFGVLTGLENAKGEFISWTHGDMQTDPLDTIKAYRLAKKQDNPNKVFVKGKRHGRPIVSKVFEFGIALAVSFVLRKKVSDIGSQPHLFQRNFLQIANNAPYDHSLDLYFYYIAKKNKYNILRLPVLFPPRVHGESNWNTGTRAKLKFLKNTIKEAKKMKKHAS